MARPKRNSRGFFETTVTIGHDANGVRQRKRLRSKTLSGLRAKQEALLAEKSKGTAQVGLKPTLDVVLDHWITNVIAPTTSRSTYAVYEGHVRLYLKPMMGKNRMGKFGLTQVQKMVQQLTEHDPPLKATTIRGIVGTLCRAMNHAIEEKIITTNPTLGVKLPDAEAPDLETVTLSDVQALLVTMRGQRLEALIWFILTTGVRVGEALAVMWDDINFDEGIITIRHAVSRVKYPDGKTRLEFHQTKGRKVRYLPLLSILRPYLEAHRVHQDVERTIEGWTEYGLVFCTTRGTPMDNPNLLSQVFRPALKRAKLSPRIRIHDLRHAIAAFLITQGVDAKTVSQVLGHASVKFTLDKYVKVLPTLATPAFEQLGQLFQSDAQTLEIPARKPPTSLVEA